MYGLLVFVAYATATLVHRWPPFLGDFPDWVYQGALLARHVRGLPNPHHVLKAYPVPNSTVTVVLGLLMLVVSWAVAAKLFLCGVFAASWYGVRRLLRAGGADGLVWLIAPGAFFLNVDFWFGLVAFQLGVALLAVCVAEVLQRPRPLVLTALLLALFFTHLVPFTFACLYLCLVAVGTRSCRPVLPALPSAGLLCWYALARWRGGEPDPAARGLGKPVGAAHFAAYKVNTLLKSVGFVNPGTALHKSVALAQAGSVAFVALLLVNTVVCVAVLWVLAKALRRWWHERDATRPQVSALWVALMLCVPVYLLLPRVLLGVFDPGSRVLQIVLFLGVAAMATRGAALRVAAIGSVVLAMWGFLLFMRVGFAVPGAGEGAVLPGALDLLAQAPYAIREPYFADLDRGGYANPVFSTGMFMPRAAAATVKRETK